LEKNRRGIEVCEEIEIQTKEWKVMKFYFQHWDLIYFCDLNNKEVRKQFLPSFSPLEA
jgi:hypothetical protein